MSSIAEQIEQARRTVANWPADVKLAMGLTPTPSAEVERLEAANEALRTQVAALARKAVT